MSETRRIALVEMGGSHDECLYSQVCYLKSEGYHVELICNLSLKSNVDYFDGLDRVHFIQLRSGLKQWIDLRIIRRILVKGKFDYIIFNTAQGNVLKNLFLLPKLKKVKCFGVIHNLRKLENSHSQKVITRNLEGYFVLNNYLIDQVKDEIKQNVRLFPLYTIFYPNYPSHQQQKKNGDIWICIPGQVERSRRDYDSLFESISTFGIQPQVKFLFLGRCGHIDGSGTYVKQRIQELEIEKNVVIWDAFIEAEEFYGVLKQSDYIMPLIHPKHESYELYQYQISGAFNLAFGFKKPLLMEESFSVYADFKNTSIFYSTSSLMEVVNSLNLNSKNYYTGLEWNFERLKQSYLKVLEL